jgi:hypothetical protein
MMRQVMPSAFCQEGTYFRACFAQDAAACVEAAKRSVDECLSQHEAQIPDILKNAEAGSRWSRVIGACAGTLFETHSRKAKRSSARCNNPEAWQ